MVTAVILFQMNPVRGLTVTPFILTSIIVVFFCVWA